MLATQDDITRYIPQRDPIVMVHNLLEASDDHAVTQLHITDNNVFIADGYLAEPGMVENIAQTAAVHVGFQCTRKGQPIPIGYIAAIRDLEIVDLPPIDSTITTTVRITNKVLDLTVARGEVVWNDKVMCSCEMRIFAKVQP
jgi:3-hydroxyacyl-[acyl-carrier-protein] dehydratase